MNTKIYRSANGRPIDFESIRLQNEDVIAVGNMRVNARGDEIGRGGKIVRTREQIMKEYYALHTPTALDDLREQMQPPVAPVQQPVQQPTQAVIPPAEKKVIHEPIIEDPIVITPDSGLDETDMEPTEVSAQPTTEPIQVTTLTPVEMPLAEVSQSTMIQFQSLPTTNIATPVKQIPKGIPAPPVVLPGKPVSNAMPVAPSEPQLRGSLASAVAKNATVTQTEKLPLKKANGIQRF